ncbi:tRNA pseudouridine(55) synthase TruB [Natronospora cellulosivora (SeqCode)]
MSELNGIINILKPPGKTSFQVVSCVRRILSCKKAGHTGTLDPSAVGVLPICLGKATKIIPYIPEDEKEYIADIILGKRTDTLDAEGEIIEESEDWKHISKDDLERTLKEFKGNIKQIPPMYSALHYKGKRLYKLARQGKEVDREPREVEIKELELLEFDLPRIKVRVLCSKGTYIRTLADDIGEYLECGAFLQKLKRSKSGPFRIENAVTLDTLYNKGEKLIVPIDFPLDFPKLYIKDSFFDLAKNGSSLSANAFVDININLDKLAFEEKNVLVYYRNYFISISQIINTEDGFEIKPDRVFNVQL